VVEGNRGSEMLCLWLQPNLAMAQQIPNATTLPAMEDESSTSIAVTRLMIASGRLSVGLVDMKITSALKPPGRF